jgi:hypothetical protein
MVDKIDREKAPQMEAPRVAYGIAMGFVVLN